MKTIESSTYVDNSVITDRYFYHRYSYPMYRNHQPRIPRSMATDHEKSIPYETWKLIVKTYFQFLLEDLIKGLRIDLPFGFGQIELGMVRRLSPKILKFASSAERENMSYVPTLFWLKGKEKNNCRIKNKKILAMEFHKPAFMKLFRMVQSDPFMPYKYLKDPASDNLYISSKKKFKR